MRFQGFETSCSPSFEPLTYGSFTDSQCFRDILLFPILFFQTPGAFAPFFSPIGFLWCSHASYFSILYLLPPRSVIEKLPFYIGINEVESRLSRIIDKN